MEHFYNKTIGENWFDYMNLYKEVVERCIDGSHLVEVGVWKGRSISYLAVEVINSKKNIKIDCIDSWDDSNVFDVFIKNIEPIKEKINIIKEISWEAPKSYKDNSIDFCFIDAAHDYDSVLKDISNWVHKVKSGGVLAGHDYHGDVKEAVKFLFGNDIIENGSCWVHYKK